MIKNKYEVSFHHASKKFLVTGGESIIHSEYLPILKIYGSTDIEKSRAYAHLARLRQAEKVRRKGEYDERRNP